jgi:hypothetical protein
MNPTIPNKPSYLEILKMKGAGDALFDKQRAGKSPKDGPNRSMPLIFFPPKFARLRGLSNVHPNYPNELSAAYVPGRIPKEATQ